MQGIVQDGAQDICLAGQCCSCTYCAAGDIEPAAWQLQSHVPLRCCIQLAICTPVKLHDTLSRNCNQSKSLLLLLLVQEQKTTSDAVNSTAHAWLDGNPNNDASTDVDAANEKVLVAASSQTPSVSSMDRSVDLENSSIDMPESSGKLKAQTYRKGE